MLTQVLWCLQSQLDNAVQMYKDSETRNVRLNQMAEQYTPQADIVRSDGPAQQAAIAEGEQVRCDTIV